MIEHDHMILENSGKFMKQFGWTCDHGRGCFAFERRRDGMLRLSTVGKNRGFQVLSPPLRHAINGNCTQRRGLPRWKDAWQLLSFLGQEFLVPTVPTLHSSNISD